MPTYEYRCKDCGHELEAQQSFEDDALTECPACGGRLRKRFGAVGISFKGSGFYKNDSRGGSGSSGGSGGSGSTSTSTAGGGDTSSTDSTSSSSDSSSTSGGDGAGTSSTTAGAGASGTSSGS